MTASLILQDLQIQETLRPLSIAAPKGFQGLASLGDHVLMLMITHPDAVKIVQPFLYLIDLPDVDVNGYAVYDETMGLSHLIVVDPKNPTDDLTVPHTRKMRFGAAILDMGFMTKRKHGDVFYIAYTNDPAPPRIVMVAVIDPTQV